MKNTTLSMVIITIFTLFSCAPKHNIPQGLFIIKGSLVNVPDSSVIELMNSDGNIMQVIGTDILVDGKFVFCESIPSDEKFLVLNSDANGFSRVLLNLWAESQIYIEIEGDGGLIVDWDIKSIHPWQKEETNFTRSTFPEAVEYAMISIEENRYLQKVMELIRKTGEYSYGEYGDMLDSIYDTLNKIFTIIPDVQEKLRIEELC